PGDELSAIRREQRDGSVGAVGESRPDLDGRPSIDRTDREAVLRPGPATEDELRAVRRPGRRPAVSEVRAVVLDLPVGASRDIDDVDHWLVPPLRVGDPAAVR